MWLSRLAGSGRHGRAGRIGAVNGLLPECPAEDELLESLLQPGKTIGDVNRRQRNLVDTGMKPPLRYGFVGLGNLGRRLARNLVANGFEVALHDRDPEAAAALRQSVVQRSLNIVGSCAEAAHGVDGLITCLPSSAATRMAIEGPEGAISALGKGATWIEMGTNESGEVLRLANKLENVGVATLEAPVTGGVHRASVGDITVLAGGDRRQFDRHRPALAAMGNPVLHVGGIGQGSAMKVITNMLAFLHLLGAGEALMLARKSGIDLGTAFEAIRHSSGNSFVHETESQVVLNGSYDIGFTLDLACKDAGFASEMGRRLGVPLPLAEQAETLLNAARERYGGDAWSPMAVRLLEDAVGTRLRAKGFPATLDLPQELSD